MATPYFRARNPYIAGKALGSERGFFGREDILRTVQEAFASGNQTAIVLAGQRRIGKTSILLQLQRSLPADRFCPVYFDLADRAEEQLGHVLNDLASAIVAASAMAIPNFQCDDDGVLFCEQFLPHLYSSLGEERRPVLLLDEFDVLDSAAQRRLENNAAAFKLFPYLRRLMEQDDRLGFVFVVGRKPDELSIQFKAAFKSALFRRVSVLAAEDARRLVLTAEREGSLRFEPAAVERILGLTSGHPLFTQLICQILWDRAHSESLEAAPPVSLSGVDGVIERTLEAGEQFFQWIWDGLPPAERIISAAIARATETAKIVSEEDLLVTLQGHGIRILTRELNVAPETLIDWEVLRRVDGGFEYFIELMRIWVHSRKPLPKVKGELDRIVVPADELFRSAETIYRQGDQRGVEELLQQVLRINPNHVNARLLLGALFLEQDRSAEAVAILEEAFQYDEDGARYPLIRALLIQGAQFETAGEEDSALKVYNRILDLSPHERNAGERRSAILMARGERNLASGNFADAHTAFTAAGAIDRIEHVAAAQRQKRISELTQELAKFALPNYYDARITILDELISLEPYNEGWKTERAAAEQKRSINRAYAEGKKALSSGDLEHSIAAFAEVVHLEPGYKDAAGRLARAVRKRAAATSLGLRWRKRAEVAAGLLTCGGVLLLVWYTASKNASLQQSLTEEKAAHVRDALNPDWEGVTANMTELRDAKPVSPDFELATGPQVPVSAYFVSNSRLLLTGGEDGMIRIWDLTSRKQVFQRDHKNPVRSLAISSRGDRFMTLAGDNTVRIFSVNPTAGIPAAEIQHVPLAGNAVAATLSPDGTKGAALLMGSNELIVFRTDTGATIGKSSGLYIFDRSMLTFNPQGDELALASGDVQVFAVPGLETLNFPLSGTYTSRVVWAASQFTIMLQGSYHSNRVFVGRLFRHLPDDLVETVANVTALAFSPDSRLYAVGTSNGLIVFDRTTSKQVWRGPAIGTTSVAFNDDGSRVATGCSDGVVRIFSSTGSIEKQ